MSCRVTALSIALLLFLLLRVQGMDLTGVRSPSRLSEFEPPEIDGSAVDDICRFFSDPTPDTTTTTTTKAATPPPVTRKQAAASTKKLTVRTPPKKPTPPVRQQPAPAGPIITNGHAHPAASLLHYLLTHGRGRPAAGSLPGFNRFPSQPIRGGGGYRETSDSDEVAAKLQKRKSVGSFSSEDSSDES